MEYSPQPNPAPSAARRLALVSLYALAMAWAEAAVVLYLRTLIGEFDPAEPPREELSRHLLLAECIREFATLVMLFTVGGLAGTTRRSRFAAGVIAFGIWDIGYYLFLIPLTGWPTGLNDWDILFLLPLPWWGPVWSPMSIAFLMISGGMIIFIYDEPRNPLWPRWWTQTACGVGALLALAVFMREALSRLPQGDLEPLGKIPERFPSVLFILSLALMSMPVVDLAVQLRPRLKSHRRD